MYHSFTTKRADGRIPPGNKKTNGTTAVVTDKPENILKRIIFYDIDSRITEKKLSSREEKLYLREIKKDITYFGKSYHRANLQIDIAGLDQNQAASKVKESIDEIIGNLKPDSEA